MKKIRAIITDDEAAARNVLAQLLTLECPEIEVIDTCSDVPSTVLSIKKHQPDVVFLDIQMPGYSGYEIIDFLENINFEIIFVTAFDHYAIKAFELNAIDYLLKPVNRLRLVQAVEKLSNKLHEKKTLEQYRLLKQSFTNQTFEHIVISEIGKQSIIQLDHIIAIEANGAYSFIHLIDSKPLTVTKNIKQFETILPSNNNFFRSHKSWIINVSHIRNYKKTFLEIMLSNDLMAKLSKYRKEEFESLLKK
ncbi:MAG TPA: response regulator [Edaphocola sp.]|nr:response regulator [Edaphocola sp.]